MIIWLTITAWFVYAGYVFLQPKQKRPPGFRGVHYLVVLAVSLYCVHLGRGYFFRQAHATIEAADKPAYTDDEIREFVGLYKWESYRNGNGWQEDLREWGQTTLPKPGQAKFPFLKIKTLLEDFHHKEYFENHDVSYFQRRGGQWVDHDRLFLCRYQIKIHKDERIEMYVLVNALRSGFPNPDSAKYHQIQMDADRRPMGRDA